MSNPHDATENIPYVPKHEAIDAGVYVYDTPMEAQNKVDRYRMNKSSQPYQPAYSGSPLPPSPTAEALEGGVKWLFKFAVRTVLCVLVLGFLALGAVIAINGNRLWAERDPLHGGIGRTIIAWKLSAYEPPAEATGYSLAQLDQSVQGGLPAITGKRLYKNSPQTQLAYTRLGYRCVISERCWAEAQSSPALSGIRTLAWASIRLDKASAPPPSHAALAGLRLYTDNEPARNALSFLAGLHERHPEDAALAAMNAQLQGSWLLHLVAWLEQQARP